MSIWTDDLLNFLRDRGDPMLDGFGGWKGVDHLEPGSGHATPAGALLETWRKAEWGAFPVGTAHDYWTADPDPAPVAAHIRDAQKVFATFGGDIAAALLMASLPHAFAAEPGAAILVQTDQLRSYTRRRIAETAQLLIDVLMPDPSGDPDPTTSLRPGGRGFVTVRTTRLVHDVIRDLVKVPGDTELPGDKLAPPGVAINQEDLLGTLGTFTVTVFDVVEKLGVPWTDEAKVSYLALWDRVGALLGIGDEAVVQAVVDAKTADGKPRFDIKGYENGLRPRTPDEAVELLALIRRRQWTPPQPNPGSAPVSAFDNRRGKILTRALLDELEAAMPGWLERLPRQVMRYLVHEDAAEALGLGGSSIAEYLLSSTSGREFVRGGRGRIGRVGPDVLATGMRIAANEISRRAFIHFIRERQTDERLANFRFPVAEPHELLSTGGRNQT